MKNDELYLLKNYHVVDYLNNKGNVCLVFFSSNGLNIQENNIENSYEWVNICKSKRISRFAKRIIFVRDIYFDFYIRGINGDIDNITKLLNLLRELTLGFDVFAVGYSSGGYMAYVLGLYLDNVKRVYSMGGIVNILDWHGSYMDYDFASTPSVIGANEEQRQYFDLRRIVNKNSPLIIGVYAFNSSCDRCLINDLTSFRSDNFYLLKLNTRKHGDYLWSYDYKYLLTYKEKKIRNLFYSVGGKNITKTAFSIKLQGLWLYTFNKMRQLIKHIGRKLKK